MEWCYPLLTKPTKNPKPNQKEDPDLERRDPLHSDILEWLQEFRENLVDDRVSERRDSHANSSHEPSLEPTPSRSVVLGTHSVHTHFRTDRNCQICQKTKINKSPVQKTHWRSRTSCRKFWWFDCSRVKVVNLETIIDVQSWCRTWPPNGSSHIYAKQKLLRKHKGAFKSSWSRVGSLKSFTLTIPWNSANFVKIFPGILVRRHHTDPKQMGLLKEQCAEYRKVRVLYCCNQVWMKIGGQIPWNVTLAKRHIFIIWWEDALWKTFWATI